MDDEDPLVSLHTSIAPKEEVIPLTKFNLLEEPWIPVRRGGWVVEVSLATALFQASEIESIETSSPLLEAALHRLILALLHRALGGPRDLHEALNLLEAGAFPRHPLESYINRYYDRFFLFHPTAPFWQVADLPEAPRPLLWNRLLPEMASGHNPTLFDHTVEDEERLPPLSYAEAARALLVHQTFAPGGLIRRFGVTAAKDAPLARAAAFLPIGPNLFVTLVLNLVPYTPDGDMPIWEALPLRLRDVEGGTTSWPLSGITRVYTWPTRAVRFLDEGGGVRFMAYGPGVEPQKGVFFRDPMVAYQLSSRGDLEPLRLRVDKSFWRDFAAMLPQARGELPATLAHAVEVLYRAREYRGCTHTQVLRVLGQVAEQAKLLDVRREVYPLPPELLSHKGKADLYEAIHSAEELGRELQRIARKVAQGLLGNKDPAEIAAFVQSLPLMRRYWAELDRAFLEFLGLLGKENAMAFWRKCLRKAARKAWQETRWCVGTQARHLKSLAEGERALWAALSGLEEVNG